MKNRPNNNWVLNAMRDDDVKYDPWGTAMSYGFAIAEVLSVFGEQVESLDYRPSPYVRRETPETYSPESWQDELVFTSLSTAQAIGDEAYAAALADLQFAARCLDRYIDWCKAAGRDY